MGCAEAITPGSDVFEQLHEAIIHVELLVAVEESVARIVGDEVHFGSAVRRHINNVFDEAGAGTSAKTNEFEAVAVQVERVLFGAAVDEDEPMALAFLNRQRSVIGIGLAIDGPALHPVGAGG